MARVTNLTEFDGRPEVLTSTSLTGGLIGGGTFLSTAPVETYLETEELPLYIARNSKAGLEIERPEGTEHRESDDGLQTVALLTDLRLLFVVGQRPDDLQFEVPLNRIVEVKSEFEGFRTSTLRIHTIDDECWLFRCRDDTEPFGERADELAQLWTHAQRLLDEAEMQVSDAESALGESAVDSARDALGDTAKKIERGRNRIREVGPAATARVDSRATALSERLVTLERKLTAAEGGQAHARAQDAWSHDEYETAASRYERAIQEYERSLSIAGQEPPQDSLERRLRGAVQERELLRVGPLVDADTARRRATENDDPEQAATWWVEALDRYRGLLTLEWGEDTREFVVDRDRVREETVEIADEAITDHIQAGRAWIQSGDRLALSGHDPQAKAVYARARKQFEYAEEIASEVRPRKLDDIQAEQELVESRQTAGVPAEPLETGDTGAVEITGFHLDSAETLADDRRLSDGERNRSPGESAHSPSVDKTGTEDSGSHNQPGDKTGESPGDDETTEGLETTPESVSEAGASSDDSSASHPEEGDQRPTDPNNGQSEDSDTDQSSDRNGAQSVDSDSDEPSDKSNAEQTPEPEVPSDHTGREPLAKELSRLSSEQFETVVSELWESQGWSTTPVSVDSPSVFDIVAMREEPEQERLGIWTVHNTDGSVDSETVARYRRALTESRGADTTTIVTTATVTADAARELTEYSISVVETDELCQLLRFEGVTDSVRALADT